MKHAYTQCDGPGCQTREQMKPVLYGGINSIDWITVSMGDWITVSMGRGGSHRKLDTGESTFCSEQCLVNKLSQKNKGE